MQLEQGKWFHLYNRTNSVNEKLFITSGNYLFFLHKYHQYMHAFWETLSYCLMPNHFHFFIRLHETCTVKMAQQSFSNFLNCYAKSFNKQYKRRGSLFQKNTKSVHVKRIDQVQSLIRYIHRNPLKHHVVNNLENWIYSSYFNFLGLQTEPFIDNDSIFEFFESKHHFKEFINSPDCNEMEIDDLIIERYE